MKAFIKKTSVLLLTGVLALGAMGGANVNAQNDEFKIGDKFTKMCDKAYVVDYKLEDVTGDNIKDNVILVGTKTVSDIFCDTLTVVVQDGKTKEYSKATYKDFRGYQDKEMLFIGDFTGDKVKDVMVSASTGGSGGIVDHMIATFKDNKPSVIFTDKENAGIDINGKYIDGYKAEIEFKDLNKKVLLDVSASKDMYIEQGIYDKEGKLLQKVEPWIYPFSQLEPIDYNRDGTFELKGYQRIVGTSNADTISHVESILKFENDKWNTKGAQYSTYLVK
ncbi:VCBS repeat-containing protein [Crassaminicella indica]|uniref:VCBS repeat-containing protein n=1 Tax=Crassaminicella indica TaxID=2855394 RepID=A0ABX8RF96_9CLOT|nr:VCBS repeat-containing protein [Crassaminicella indica]QXM05616.1 VCBS repeat-containing protein [Crassaminicella indica]